MTEPTFVHAVDLHLDSPLLGLVGKFAAYAARVEAAFCEAFDNLVALAIDEGCRFMLLAGDIFDGDLRNFQTGLYLMEGMRRLDEPGICVFMVLKIMIPPISLLTSCFFRAMSMSFQN